MKTLMLAAFLMGPADQSELRATVYDRSGMSEQTRTEMLAGAARIFARAGVRIRWVSGDLHSAESRFLEAPRQPRRGGEREAGCRARVDIALDLLRTAPEGLKGSILGMGLPFASKGLNVRVFADRVEEAAARQNQRPEVVAAHVLAHEIGHVLLRSNDHSTAGLMAAFWTGHEYWRIANGMLLFSDSESSRMRLTLNRAGCDAAPTN